MEINARSDASNTITFSGALSLPGKITPWGYPTVNRNIVITGPGADLLTIDCGFNAGIFDFNPPDSVVIEGLTLAHGMTDTGGAVNQGGGSLTLREVVVRDSIATIDGGGIRCQSCDLTVERSRISGNAAAHGGGRNFGSIWKRHHH